MGKRRPEQYGVADHGMAIITDGKTDWSVWLNTSIEEECDGLCIGVGESRVEALIRAAIALKAVTAALEDLLHKKG